MIKILENNHTFGLVMPNLEVINIPEGFEFVRIQSSPNEFVHVWLRCIVDGIDYPFSCKYKGNALVVHEIQHVPTIEEMRRENIRLSIEEQKRYMRNNAPKHFAEPAPNDSGLSIAYIMFGVLIGGMVISSIFMYLSN